jgi:hypothetical protein
MVGAKGFYDTHRYFKKVNTFTRVEKMDGHEVKTVIEIIYPGDSTSK